MPTVLLNEIIAFGWHLFTNSCTQNLLAQRASGESVFGCPTENLLVPGNRTGGNFEPWSQTLSQPKLKKEDNICKSNAHGMEITHTKHNKSKDGYL